jgi:hypothetical protein
VGGGILVARLDAKTLSAPLREISKLASLPEPQIAGEVRRDDQPTKAVFKMKVSVALTGRILAAAAAAAAALWLDVAEVRSSSRG